MDLQLNLYITVTLPLHYCYITVTLPLHYCYITVTGSTSRRPRSSLTTASPSSIGPVAHVTEAVTRLIISLFQFTVMLAYAIGPVTPCNRGCDPLYYMR